MWGSTRIRVATMTSSPIARVKVEVTPAMIEAARVLFDGAGFLTNTQIAEAYRRMRALEPGPHMGVAELHVPEHQRMQR